MKMLIKNFTMSFLIVGHTHEDVDQEFYLCFPKVGYTHKDTESGFLQ